jgi:hypothetical protein
MPHAVGGAGNYRSVTEHTAIFPQGRAPLQRGTLEQRIAAVLSLHGRMQNYVATLGAPLLAEVLGFHAQLLALRNKQQSEQGGVDADSTALEAARVAAAEMMYGNLGVLMDAFRASPEAVADFFDLSLIRETGGEDEDANAPTPPAP